MDMNNTRFYAFCRDQRRKETDEFKRNVLKDLYDFMREVGVGRRMINMYIEERVKRANAANQPNVAAAYQWLAKTFEQPEPAQTTQGQATLL